MLPRIRKPFVWLSIFILVLSLACNAAGTTTTEVPPAPPEPSPTTAPTQETVQEPATPTTEPATDLSGKVSSLQDVKSAVIQIQAEGTFVYPDGVSFNTAGRGSGFIIDPEGIAVTNNHVVTGAGLLKVWVGGDTSRTYNARVLGVSECSDLAVIDIEGSGFPYMDWFGENINVGLEVYSAGFPLGDPEYTLTKGIVSKERAGGESNWASVDYVLEHDATINPGNSGGPLVSSNGQLVGVNYAGNSSTNQYFAIGRDLAQGVINSLRSGSDLDSIGVNGEAFFTDAGSSGIWVYSVKAGSPADKAGVRGGDIISQLQGLILATDGTMADYCDVLRTHSSTSTMDISALRWFTGDLLSGQLNGREMTVVGNLNSDDTGSTDSTGSSGDEFVMIASDEGTIQMQVPGEWFVDGTDWVTDWGSFSFSASSISASPDLDAYWADDWSVPGVFFAASRSMSRIGGYVQLLDGVRIWYSGDCTYRSRNNYEDSLYEGQYDLWERCDGSGNLVLVLAARPKADPGSFLMLVEIRMVTTDDFPVRDAVLNSFEVVGNLP